jgi:hypothetical protein
LLLGSLLVAAVVLVLLELGPELCSFMLGPLSEVAAGCCCLTPRCLLAPLLFRPLMLLSSEAGAGRPPLPAATEDPGAGLAPLAAFLPGFGRGFCCGWSCCTPSSSCCEGAHGGPLFPTLSLALAWGRMQEGPCCLTLLNGCQAQTAGSTAGYACLRSCKQATAHTPGCAAASRGPPWWS